MLLSDNDPTPVMGVKHAMIPTIAFINKAKTPLGVDLHALVAALQSSLDTHFAPVWNTTAKLVVATDFIPGAWAMVFTDTADVAGALGYHDVTPEGLPLGHVFVKTTIDDGEKVSVTTDHELKEMLVDPGIQLCAQSGSSFYAYEVCDAVEETTYKVQNIDLSNFVTPEYFEAFRKPKSVKFDHLGLITRPFQLLKGGYMPVFKRGSWTQVFGRKWTYEFGSAEKKAKFNLQDRIRRRSHRRAHK